MKNKRPSFIPIRPKVIEEEYRTIINNLLNEVRFAFSLSDARKPLFKKKLFSYLKKIEKEYL